MKKTGVYLIIFILTLQLAGCYKTEDGEYIEPITIYEKINGKWNLSSLKYIDAFAKSNNIEPSEENLSNWFNYKDFQLTLNVDENNVPSDYSVTGDVPELFPSNGYWQLSSAFQTTNSQPIFINLYSDSNKTNQIGTLRLISIPGANNTLEIALERKSNDVPLTSYVFKLFLAN